MESKTKIIVSRSSEWVNRMRTFKILINGTEVGKVKNGSSEELTIQPGANLIQCKVDWYSSKPFSINVQEGETAYIRVKSGMKLYWPFLITILAGVFLVFYYRGKIDKPDWVTPVSMILLIPGLLYSLYYLTLGRKNYLVLEKDSKNVFA